MGLENLKYLWDDLTSGAEYDTEGLYDEPNAPANDHWFKDYALPVGLNALMAFPQGLKDMFVDAPTEVIKGHPLKAMDEYFYPLFGAFEGYKDQYQFPFNPDLDPEFDVTAYRPPLTPSIDDLLIKMINSQKPVISDIGKWGLTQGAGTSNLSDYTNIPGNLAAQYFGGKGLAGLALAGGPQLQWLASKAYPWTTQGKLPSLSKAIEPWRKSTTDKVGIFKNFYNKWIKPGMPTKETSKQWGVNVGLPLAYHGIYGDSDISNVFDVEAATISDDWGRDSDPVVFDDVMTEKIQNFKPTPRGPGPWNEFKG